MVIVVLYTFAWFLTYIRQKNKIGKFSPSLLIIASYVVYGIFSILYYNNLDLYNYIYDIYRGHRDYHNVRVFPFIYLYFMLMLALYPSINYDKENIQHIQCPSIIIIHIFIIVYTVCSLTLLPTTISKISSNFYVLIGDSEGANLLYHMNRMSGSSEKGVAGFIGFVSIIQNIFSEINCFVFCYYMTLKKRKRILVNIEVFVITINFLVLAVSGGRTSIVMVLWAIIISILVFYPFFDNNVRGKVKFIGFCMLIILAIPVILITIGRFAGRSVFDSIISYIGMANINFNIYGLDANGIRYGDRTMNLFKRWLGLDTYEGIMEVRSAYSYMKMNDRLFYTFVGDFTLDFGPIVAIIIFVLFSISFFKLTKTKNNKITFHKLLIVFFTLCICSQGGMYLFYFSFVQGNLHICAFALMYVILWLDNSMKSSKEYRYISTNQNLYEKSVYKPHIRFVFALK